MGSHFGKNLPTLWEVHEFPTSVGGFHEICYSLKTLAQLASKFTKCFVCVGICIYTIHKNS